MPTIFRRSNGIYYILFREGQRTRWLSTGKKLKSEALHVLVSQEAERTRPPQVEKPEAQKPSNTFRAFIDEFLIYAQANYSPKTKDMYRRTLERFLAFVGKKPIEAIGSREIDAYKVERLKTISGVSVNLELRTLRAAFYTALRWNLILRNPCKGVSQIRVPETEPVYLTEGQFESLLGSIEEPWLRDLVIFAATTGLRRSEILNLRWEDVQFEDRLIRVRNHGTFRTKTGKNRTLPMSEVVFNLLLDRKKKARAELVFTHRGRPITPERATRSFKKVARKVGLNDRMHFHCLRHTFASWLVQRGASIYEIQKLLGHSSIKVTQIYSHLGSAQLHQTVGRLNDVFMGGQTKPSPELVPSVTSEVEISGRNYECQS